MRTLLCAALLAATVTAPAAHAGGLLGLAVVDRDTGITLPTYADRGRLYVAGTPGHRYAVRLTNRSGGRVLAVLSVDGVNAVSGQTASPEQTGYVLAPWESTEVAGWRKNLDEIAQFNFTALPDSYAARTGRPANVGVIGVAVFAERAPPPRPREEIAAAPPAPAAAQAESRKQAADAERAPADMMARSAAPLGTGHGAREYAHVGTTTFERASNRPAETVTIWYDSYANLVARGVIARPIAREEPQPFPGGFVPDPPVR
jgi:hypothetical protein